MTTVDNSFHDSSRKTFVAIGEALTDQGLTTGAKVSWGPRGFLVGGNMADDDPALSFALIDDLGRIWKERHHGGSHELVCVLDLRTQLD